jgi:hypothetical protein
VSKKRASDAIDADVGSLTLSLSNILPPVLKPDEAIPVDQWVREYPFDVADWGDRKVEYEDDSVLPVRPRWSGQLFTKKPTAT